VTRYLIAISIGPVQEFIAAARKTADLYSGSQLLMDIVGAAAEEFPADERIYPASLEAGGANKILAIVSGDPAQHAENAKRRARAHLRTVWEATVAPLERHVDMQRAEAQLESLLEFYTAWTPLADEPNGYGKARRRVEQLLSGRKALRDFSPADQRDEGIPKSPLDPAFAAVLKLEKGQVPKDLQARYGFKPSEVLDAVSLLKRLYGRGELKDKVLNTHTLAHRAKFPDAANSDEDDFTPAYTYFAILVADGDNMGAMLSARESAEAHHEISSRLDNFASQAGKIVERHGGMAAYTGGDDVLALLPVTTALDCGKELADAFKHTVRGTLSAGIAIVHYREPLSMSLKNARAAEKKAKQIEGKAAVCITLHTRGGSPLVTAQKWDKIGNIQAWQQANLPRGLPYELHQLARAWPEGFSDDKALTAEAKRIAKRKSDSEGRKLSEEALETWHFTDAEALIHFADQLILARFLSGQGERA
jgi:CRISPR-associated protein Cmr2